jgi:hypothetical protein
MGSLVKNPDLFGGQGVSEPPRLCIDCANRPIRYGKEPGIPACGHSNAVIEGVTQDPIAARELCKGKWWRFSSSKGARG